MNKILKTVIAGLLTASVSMSAQEGKQKTSDPDPMEKVFECHGGNECKAKGACGGAGWDCSGNNGCGGKGFVMVASRQSCDALKAKVARMKKAAKPVSTKGSS